MSGYMSIWFDIQFRQMCPIIVQAAQDPIPIVRHSNHPR